MTPSQIPFPDQSPSLSPSQALRFARLPLAGLRRIYPNHLMHLMTGPDDFGTPVTLHPMFHGCYDWHSAVHGVWLLVRCLSRHPDLPVAGEIRDLLNSLLTEDAGRAEAAYFKAPGRAGFERPYGWGWLLALVAEVDAACEAGEGAAAWRTALAPLEQFVARALPDYLNRLSYPVRAGVHSNTAFALILALHYARRTGDPALASAIGAAARRYYLGDADYPAHYEPGGDDFLSGGLTEAMLLAACLPPGEFAAWFRRFLPAYAAGGVGPYRPATVSDRSDAKIVHLDGLNLSRCWCLRAIAAVLPPAGAAGPSLRSAAKAHLDASLPHIDSGDFVGEHWLASFALLAIDGLAI